MAKIGLPKGSGKRLKVREKSVKSQGILKWILSGNPVWRQVFSPIWTMLLIHHEKTNLLNSNWGNKNFRGQKYLNIALVLQVEWLTTFTHSANTCTCPLTEHKWVICNMISSSNSFESTRPTGQVLWEEFLVLSRFHSLLPADKWNFCPLTLIRGKWGVLTFIPV